MDLQEVPTRFLLNNRKGFANHYHKIIQEAHKNNEPWFNPDLKKVLKKFSFPFYFMDFEYVDQGIPIVKNTKPYVKLPFQWSVHKWESKDKEIDKKGKYFLKLTVNILLDSSKNTATISRRASMNSYTQPNYGN